MEYETVVYPRIRANTRIRDAADFGCLVRGGGEVMATKKPRSVPDYFSANWNKSKDLI